MSTERNCKRSISMAQSVPQELQSLAEELDSCYASDGYFHKEELPVTFSTSRMLVEGFSADYIRICEHPSVYHPICCCVKVSL